MVSHQNSPGPNDPLWNLLHNEQRLINSDYLKPQGEADDFAPFTSIAIDGLPEKLSDLGESIARSHDLSVTAALDLQIPVAGSGSGSFNRRVIVLERCAFKQIEQEDTDLQFGYAVRLCVTVDRLEATAKISLPFLAASAQLGTVEAQWTLQVVGLAGPLLTHILPPTELNVETFVLAKQSMGEIVDAINSEDTIFLPRLIAKLRKPDPKSTALKQSVGHAFALSCIDHGRSLNEAYRRLGPTDQPTHDAIGEVYKNFAGLIDLDSNPDNNARQRAREICGRVKSDIPWLG